MTELSNYNFDLGKHTRTITTFSPEAQTWFNLGLNWVYGFNQEEAVVCFKNAAKADPDCAMAYWGIAYAAGPFYNMPWRDFSLAEAKTATAICYNAAQTALVKMVGVTQLEQDLITAITQRFQADHPVEQSEYDKWDDDFANAMRRVYKEHPHDMDVVAWFVEAAMTRTPWKLWNYYTGEALPGSDTLEVQQVLETALSYTKLKDLPLHPGLLHFYIHLMEMSNFPERALEAAQQLYMIAPDSGHLNHMPGHIHMLVGDYLSAAQVSKAAIDADNKYVAYAGADNFYTTARCHDYHLSMYANMMLGRFEPALQAANGIREALSADLLAVDRPFMAMTMEGYYSMTMHVQVRFGKWQDIINTPEPACPVLYCVSTAMHHYAKGVSFAALKQFEAAKKQVNLFEAAYARLPADRFFFNNPATNTLDVAREMLMGELNYHMAVEGLADFTVAFEHLRQAVTNCDALYYNEPWAWMHPPRHALGALLLEQGHVVEAEAVYRADLGLDSSVPRCMWHPDNVWALHGLCECLNKLGKPDEAKIFNERLLAARAQADVSIGSSCCCRS